MIRSVLSSALSRQLFSTLLLAAAFGVSSAACTITEASDSDSSSKKKEKKDGDDSKKDDDEEEEEDLPPHSLGTITLGESHSSENRSNVAPFVSASFVPDASKALACGRRRVEGCTVIDAPNCDDSKGESKCDDGEYCTWDDSCNAVCKIMPYCEKACDDDEICELKPNAKDNEGRCVARDTFDAGTLAFSGTTTPITLFPPYAYESDGKGAPFLTEATLKVKAEGASEAGFEAFEEEFTAIGRFMQVSKIDRAAAFGTGALPIAWKAGDDEVKVTLAGPGGVASCKADDKSGELEVARAVLDAVIGKNKDITPTLSVTVSRQRTVLSKDKTAIGDEVNGVEVISEGWLELVTTSNESTSLRGCSSGSKVCDDECVDLKNDSDNCGSCGNRCSGSKVCGGGQCVSAEQACNTCIDSALGDECKSEADRCNANAACKAFIQCLGQCNDQTCANECATSNEAGLDAYNSQADCLQEACYNACE